LNDNPLRFNNVAFFNDAKKVKTQDLEQWNITLWQLK